MLDTKFAVVIPTYQRKDGRTPFCLMRALESIKAQTYQNYKVFLIGDKYETPEQVISILTELADNRVEFVNLSYAKEREKYEQDPAKKYQLWCYGGVNATNVGIRQALSEGYEYICHLDHDDWWFNNHLECFNKCIKFANPAWMCTKSTYAGHSLLPRISNSLSANIEYIKYVPVGGDVIHSSVCMNFKTIPLFYRDIFEETGMSVSTAADEDLWNRTAKVLQAQNLTSVFINLFTCRHDEEAYTKQS